MSGTFTIVAYTVHIRWRPLFFGSLGAVAAISSVGGPLIGGSLTQGPGWRWWYIRGLWALLISFYVNLPFGAITILATSILLPHLGQRHVPPTIKGKLENLDILGALFLMPSIVMLLMSLQWGGAKYPWNNSRIIGLFIGFGITFPIFIFIEIKQRERATIPPRIVKERSVVFCFLFVVFVIAGFFAYLTYRKPLHNICVYYLVPIFYQALLGSTPLHSGLQLLPLFLAMSR